MPDKFQPEHRSWYVKFSTALTALVNGMRGQSSFAVHGFAAIAAIALGAWFGLERWEWCAISISIATVFAAEMFNRSIEVLAKAVTPYVNRHVRMSLDIASAAVLIVAVGSVVAGLIVFVPHLWQWIVPEV